MKAIKILFVVAFSLTGIVATAQAQGEWGEWQKTSCYSKIMFRLKYEGIYGEQHLWKTQFKTDYNTIVSFNYSISDESGEYDTTTHRKVINPGTISTEQEIYTGRENINLIVDKVSLSPYPKDFVDCE